MKGKEMAAATLMLLETSQTLACSRRSKSRQNRITIALADITLSQQDVTATCFQIGLRFQRLQD